VKPYGPGPFLFQDLYQNSLNIPNQDLFHYDHFVARPSKWLKHYAPGPFFW